MGNKHNKTTSTNGNYSLVLGWARWIPALSLSCHAVSGGQAPVPGYMGQCFLFWGGLPSSRTSTPLASPPASPAGLQAEPGSHWWVGTSTMGWDEHDELG